MHCKVCFFDDVTPDEAVCRRCARNFSRSELRHVVGLCATYFLLCRFSYYLLTGNFFTGLWKGSLFGPYSLSTWATNPVDLVTSPLHLVTLGWLMALVLVLPALVATLFGRKAGVALALVGGVLGGPPAFVLVTVPAAVLAGTTLHRRLALAPSVWLSATLPFAYFLAVTLGALGRVTVFGLVWAITLIMMALHIKLTLHRVGRQDLSGTFLLKTVATEMVLLLAFFTVTVGFDTVEYEGLRNRAWCLGERFKGPVGPDTRGRTSQELARLLDDHLAEIRGVRERSIAEFQGFLGIFPRSRFAPLALFEIAELHNMRFDVAQTTPLIIRIHTDHVSPEAVPLYEQIIAGFNESIAAAYARLRLADFHAQHADIKTATRQYDKNILAVYGTHVPQEYEAPTYHPVTLSATWRSHEPDEALRKLAFHDVMTVARQRLRFITENADYNNIPLILYLQADPLAPDFLDRTRPITEWFGQARVVDNILWDRTLRSSLKVNDLLSLYEQHPHGDVAPSVLLELAGRYLKKPYEPETAYRYYQTLLSRFANTPQADRARKELGEQFKNMTTTPRKTD